MKKWRCTVCGYTHEGDTPPEKCPVCGVGPELFELEGYTAADKQATNQKRWKCTVCGYIHEGDTPPEKCPVCGVGPEFFELEGNTADKQPIVTKQKRWKCTVCGYIHEGDMPPEKCPVCGVGPEFFELEGYVADKQPLLANQKRWKCTICDYIHTGEKPPEKCPLCGVGPEAFVLLEDSIQELTAESIAAADMGTTGSALEQISYGLYIVTSTKEEKFNGQCANAVFQLTAKPPTIAICINKNNLTHEYIKYSKTFAISVLGSERPEHLTMVRNFGYRSGRAVDKFADVDYISGQTGSPILKSCIAYLEGRVLSDKIVDVGTHTLFVADVIAGRVVTSEKPLTYAYYRDAK